MFLGAQSAQLMRLFALLSITYTEFDVQREIASSTPRNQAQKPGMPGAGFISAREIISPRVWFFSWA